MRLGLTWGVWDLLHVGHVRFLQRAAARVDRLYVGVTTDEHCIARKGKRPVITYEDRIEMLLSLPTVHHCFPQSGNYTKADAVRDYHPTVLLVASDWTPFTYEGRDLGVPVVYLPRTEGVSSTSLREAVTRAAP